MQSLTKHLKFITLIVCLPCFLSGSQSFKNHSFKSTPHEEKAISSHHFTENAIVGPLLSIKAILPAPSRELQQLQQALPRSEHMNPLLGIYLFSAIGLLLILFMYNLDKSHFNMDIRPISILTELFSKHANSNIFPPYQKYNLIGLSGWDQIEVPILQYSLSVYQDKHSNHTYQLPPKPSIEATSTHSNHPESLRKRAVVQAQPTKEEAVWLNALKAQIREQISDHQLTVIALAEHFNMSESVFFRKVKKVSNQSPIKLIQVIRIEQAIRLLDQRNHGTLAQIAAKVGYKDTRSFSRRFKKHQGLLPSEYLKCMK